ncbi:MAG: YkvA family protein [Terracidiphilus sp.]
MSALIASWAEKAQRLQKEAHVFYFAFKHPGTPWYARLIAACAAGYLLSPIQIIPSFIPVIGFMDDLVVLVVGFKLIQKTISPEVLEECRERAEAAEAKRKSNDSSVTDVVISVTVAILWLISAIAGSLLIASYLRRR